MANECQLKDQTILVERGVYQKKMSETKPGSSRIRTKSESTSSTNLIDTNSLFVGSDFTDHLSVKEDNITKYMLSNKSYAVSDGCDDDSEFESSDEETNENDEQVEYETDDNQSNISEENMDTFRNRHFYIWKFSTNIKKKEKQTNHLLRQNEIDSDSEFVVNESTDYSSSESDSSSQDDNKNQSDESDSEGDAKKSTQSLQKKQLKLIQEDTEIFFNEVIEIIERGLKQNLDSKNVILEINSSKHANNIQVKKIF